MFLFFSLFFWFLLSPLPFTLLPLSLYLIYFSKLRQKYMVGFLSLSSSVGKCFFRSISHFICPHFSLFSNGLILVFCLEFLVLVFLSGFVKNLWSCFSFCSSSSGRKRSFKSSFICPLLLVFGNVSFSFLFRNFFF